MFWVIIGVCVIPLIYTIGAHNKKKRDRARKLELIQKRLSQIEKNKESLDSTISD